MAKQTKQSIVVSSHDVFKLQKVHYLSLISVCLCIYVKMFSSAKNEISINIYGNLKCCGHIKISWFTRKNRKKPSWTMVFPYYGVQVFSFHPKLYFYFYKQVLYTYRFIRYSLL